MCWRPGFHANRLNRRSVEEEESRARARFQMRHAGNALLQYRLHRRGQTPSRPPAENVKNLIA